jgi:pimeloyl-ACP methyl ester carboxylesterase
MTSEKFVDVDGIRTHYFEAGIGPTVVLLHSGEFGGCAEFSWERTIPALESHYRVVAPDWLGFGLTDKVYDFADAQGRRRKHMGQFLRSLDINRAAFIGNSMGGTLLAREAASPHTTWPIAALVLAAAGGFAPMNDARRITMAYDCTIESMRELMAVFFKDPRWAADDEYLARRHRASVLAGAWECTAAARFRSPAADPRTDFGQSDQTPYELIAARTLVIAGADDPLRESGYALELGRRIPNATVHIYEDCGHMPNIEQAERFNSNSRCAQEPAQSHDGWIPSSGMGLGPSRKWGSSGSCLPSRSRLPLVPTKLVG